ncbi:PHB depolymerase family esterase [Altererythrobacter sp. KTW20L]|uniref:extracellular catalytic domain type 1 short-chain-length polyhydroxyalkanoate depolymerase n=1 Tax=Altererythrobacter sp. KTW20L TaxID=2942210 RepID=UPI0020BFCCC4|nr:PHB depolymerase family esterase [Altererythrobacter sp. KTW20L]MCL6250829.1 PHB depolymerase family esterase [Altererythrobacter sp. KTW20L]
MYRSLASNGSLPGLARAGGETHLRPLTGFGSNPGNLGAWTNLPGESGPPVPLVVVLHGCTQTAAAYDSGSGWSALAQAYGFAVLLPEQRRANNPNLCFNWFADADTRRGSGEALSIAQMIDALVDQGAVDPAKVFITGLSAGGAMASTMLAVYPEKFVGGAILAGLPHGVAGSVGEAFEQMRGHRPSPRALGHAIRSASDNRGRWPAVAIWHGTADTVVDQSNADAILRQWCEIHDLPTAPTETRVVETYPYRAWHAPSGEVLIEEYRVTGMGHGTPLSTKGDCGCGISGAYMLEVGISSTIHSAKAWQLLGKRVASAPASASTPAARPPRSPRRQPEPSGSSSIGETIEAALRAAGLMK